ncbi:MAG: LPS-assembly protein LptD, partial [Nitrospiraceae bacterium]
MVPCLPSVIRVSFPLLFVLFMAGVTSVLAADADPSQSVSVKPPSPASQPIDITGDRLEYLRNVDVYEAEGSVVVVQGQLRLTADHVTLMMLTGTMVATGHVHLTDPITDLKAERLELDVNTDAGVVTNGKLYIKESNSLITGRILQRFSESHYRVKDGSFTNCDAQEGQIPAWRFTFEDFDLNVGEGVYGRKVWFCINDRPMLRMPSMFYPIQTTRKTGFLIPTVGYDNRFGLHYRQGFFWAINPSHDVIVTPDFLSNRGYGGDLEYRYVLDRLSRGQWLM